MYVFPFISVEGGDLLIDNIDYPFRCELEMLKLYGDQIAARMMGVSNNRLLTDQEISKENGIDHADESGGGGFGKDAKGGEIGQRW